MDRSRESEISPCPIHLFFCRRLVSRTTSSSNLNYLYVLEMSLPILHREMNRLLCHLFEKKENVTLVNIACFGSGNFLLPLGFWERVVD